MQTVRADSVTLEGGKIIITPREMGEAYRVAREFAGKTATVKFSRETKKRALSANAYAWVLMNEIAKKMQIPVVDVYREAIRNISGVSDILRLRADTYETFKQSWESNGYGWQVSIIGAERGGWLSVQIWYGSSSYDTRQMSELIDHIAQDCRALGIETWTGAKLSLLLEEWSDIRKQEIVPPEG